MNTIIVTRYKRVGAYLQPNRVASYTSATLKEHDDLIGRLLKEYGDQPDIGITGPGHVTYKERAMDATMGQIESSHLEQDIAKEEIKYSEPQS